MKKSIFLCTLFFFCIISGCNRGAISGHESQATQTAVENTDVEDTTNSLSGSEIPQSENGYIPENGCIPPLFPLAFPYSDDDIPFYTEPGEHYDPASPWQYVVDLPSPSGNTAGGSVELIREYEGKEELWIISSYGILRYRIQAKTWDLYGQIDGHAVLPTKLILGVNNEVWGLGYYPWDEEAFSETVLIMFNDASGQFESVFNFDEYFDAINLEVSAPVVDENGILWLVIREDNGGSFYSFDPYSKTLELIIPAVGKVYGYVPSLVYMARNNSILMAQLSENQIHQYFLDTQTLGTYEMPDGLDLSSLNTRLFLNHSDHLWVDDLGWLDLSGDGEPVWYKVIRSPLFIYPSPNPPGDAGHFWNIYVWGRAEPYFESSDGILWFNSPRGGTWLDTESATWCLFTSDTYGGFVEDLDHTLWTIAYGKLYGLKLNE